MGYLLLPLLLHYAQFIFADKENSKKMAWQRKEKKISSNFYVKEAPLG